MTYRIGDSSPALDVKRASLFTLARLAEFPENVADPLFQEKAAALLAHVEQMRGDDVSLANLMVLTRNFVQFTPKMRSRIADTTTLSALVSLLMLSDEEPSRIGADVLAHALYFEKPKGRRAVGATTSSGIRQRTVHAVASSASIDAKLSVESVRHAMLPGWRRLFYASSSAGLATARDDDGMMLLSQELDEGCAMLPVATREELLRVLLELHLPRRVHRDSEPRAREIEPDADVIMDQEPLPLPREPRFLQYVLPAAFRSAPEPYDTSLVGSARLWHFVRLLWRMCSFAGNTSIHEFLSRVAIGQVGDILSQWTAQRDVGHSERSIERRARFLRFVVTVVDSVPEIAASSLLGADFVGIADLFFENEIASGVAYELLYTLCCQDSANTERLLQHFTTTGEDRSMCMPQGFLSFIRGVKLEYLPVRVSTLKARSQDTETAVTLLDPRAPSTPAIAYGIGVLNFLSSRSSIVANWIVEMQGIQTLFDLLMLDAAFTSRLPPSVRVTYTSNLAELLGNVVAVNTGAVQLIQADARLLSRIVSLMYAIKSRTQLAALGLLLRLTEHPRTTDMLCELENMTTSVSVVDTTMVERLQSRLDELRITPPLRPKEVVELAHMLQIPFFLDLTTTEIMRLSLGFVESRLIEDESFMILAGDGHFSDVPSWMLCEELQSTDSKHQVQQSSVMKRIRETFLRAGAAQESPILYKIQRDGYCRFTTQAVRKRIAKRTLQLLAQENEFNGYDSGHDRATPGLISRLCRFLVEDRAEIVRRVSFAKRLSEQNVFRSAQSKKLCDLVTLLSHLPLFSGVSRDNIACLAHTLSSPRMVAVHDLENSCSDSAWLILDDDVQYAINSICKEHTMTTCARRGTLIGLPEWLGGTQPSVVQVRFTTRTARVAVFATALTERNLRDGLGEQLFLEITQRCRNVMKEGGADGLVPLMKPTNDGAGVPPNTLSPSSEHRQQQQIAALQLLKQLIATEDMALKLVTNAWATRVIIDVATSALPPTIVVLALEIIGTLAADQASCRLFCRVKPIAYTEDDNDASEETSIGSDLSAFVYLVCYFSIAQWSTNPLVLQRFFDLQHHVFGNNPPATESISRIWTTEYFVACQFVLHQDTLSEFRSAEVVAEHLTRAIPSHSSLVQERCLALTLHLDVVAILMQSAEPIQGENLLELVCFLCEEPVARAQVWTQVDISADSFDQVLRSIASNLQSVRLTHSAPSSSSSNLTGGSRKTIRSYCEFMNLICSSEIDDVRDAAIRERVELRFSILSTLIPMLSTARSLRYVRFDRCLAMGCSSFSR